MEKTGMAYFVDFPRILPDLQQPHLLKAERPYKIVKTITLGKMDYDNFCTDMIADRQFIEDYADLCGTGEVWRCLLILFTRKRVDELFQTYYPHVFLSSIQRPLKFDSPVPF